jgi:hypothetical protein
MMGMTITMVVVMPQPMLLRKAQVVGRVNMVVVDGVKDGVHSLSLGEIQIITMIYLLKILLHI